MSRVLLDTGPLVAFLNVIDEHHRWAVEVLADIPPPLRTCDSVLSEVCFLVREHRGGPPAALQLVERGILRPEFSLDSESVAVRSLLRKYADVPMSLVDA